MSSVSLIMINDRAGEYGVRNGCRQCPEQCRIDEYTGSCGVSGNTGDAYVDCSLASCPDSCRIEQPLPPQHEECQPYSEGDASCDGCPVLCRRQVGMISGIEGCEEYPECTLSSDPSYGCSEFCRLDNPPDRACEGCLDCDMDCVYYPAIRSDCSDICSDAALAGPVNIAPNDFIKSLPGAKTSYTAVRDIGVLYIPAVVLPLFCIVIVISFVRILSPILGGDIEIPGLGRII
jgi:hypothetical protein